MKIAAAGFYRPNVLAVSQPTVSKLCFVSSISIVL